MRVQAAWWLVAANVLLALRGKAQRLGVHSGEGTVQGYCAYALGSLEAAAGAGATARTLAGHAATAAAHLSGKVLALLSSGPVQ